MANYTKFDYTRVMNPERDSHNFVESTG